MADFISKNRRTGLHPVNRREAKVDLTPMVDLAFLLITFFMLTTSLVKPNVMPLVMPDNHPSDVPDFRKESQVLTLILAEKNNVFYYEGISNPVLDSTTFAAEGLRHVILDKKKRVDLQWPPSEKSDSKIPGSKRAFSKLTVLIKPTRDAKYKNVVDALDEMNICSVAHYILMDVSAQELAYLENPGAGLNFNAAQQIKAATR